MDSRLAVKKKIKRKRQNDKIRQTKDIGLLWANPKGGTI